MVQTISSKQYRLLVEVSPIDICQLPVSPFLNSDARGHITWLYSYNSNRVPGLFDELNPKCDLPAGCLLYALGGWSIMHSRIAHQAHTISIQLVSRIWGSVCQTTREHATCQCQWQQHPNQCPFSTSSALNFIPCSHLSFLCYHFFITHFIAPFPFPGK